ncbi:MAG TPA: DUF2252 domain-containing protein, partial [Candidatus Bathyarchaeia archaeon]|nr:DUF2252 domain-containing protein [Candidatus Bathyarchaeia archaeon]
MKRVFQQHATREARRQAGRALRNKVARGVHAEFNPKARMFEAVALMNAAHKGRLPELVPLKNARMAENAFAFFRGSAPLMAADLAITPRTGILVQICGDAHVQNLGAFGGGTNSHLIFDINDFDETIRAPWEWDVKRMAASLVLAGRSANNTEDQCKDAVEIFTRTYREFVWKFSELPVLELARYLVMRELKVSPVRAVLRQAERATPMDSLKKLALHKHGRYVFTTKTDSTYDVALQRPIAGDEAKAVRAALPGYLETLQPERRHFFRQYKAACFGFRVVGTGSVGTRDYMVLMFGGALDDPMFLQLKQELPSAYAPYLPKGTAPRHHGQRVVEGIRRMLVQTDPFLGWATIEGLPYLVRQLRDHKGGIETSDLVGKALAEYAQVCGELLAKGHSRSGDPCLLAGYLGKSDRFDQALVSFAVDYADQVERDHDA